MSDTTLWWIAAGVIVGLELLTGTFYLLMLALGAAAAAISAQMGHPLSTQMLIAGVVGGVAALGWHLKRQRSKDHAQSEGRANPDLHLDLGQTVEVAQWSADGRTRVHYRGADWDARYLGAPPAQTGPHRIQAVEGNTLVLAKI
ncbi:MAG: NfeD family protein [Aquabacterium sp.]|uniref:NfeD family protein n=1 Tax=Aquabacterium sp. TaxID=1872578 RepID=UPI0027265FA0|nr:NfeD family protein [Aquabacterium sp.]MDO9006393.1 NfeD family protein [Aquabacterium sp.]